MKSSKHVETCFVRANNDFDDRLTAFWMKKKNLGKNPQKRTLCRAARRKTLVTGLRNECSPSFLRDGNYLIIMSSPTDLWAIFDPSPMIPKAPDYLCISQSKSPSKLQGTYFYLPQSSLDPWLSSQSGILSELKTMYTSWLLTNL